MTINMKAEKRDWADPSRFVQHIHVAEDVVSSPIVQKIIERTKLPVSIVPVGETPYRIEGDCWSELTRGKRNLYLCRNRGSFFKPCPGTAEYTCCGYHILNVGMNCPMDCVYCILQAYLNQPWMTVYVNVEDIFNELDIALDQQPDQFFRIGTGEFADSLALENITGLSKLLIEYMAAKNNAILELKTKSSVIDSLLSAKHNGRTILSWSLNSRAVMQRQELRTATIQQRVAAASRAADAGYKLAFHFDPIVVHENWQKEYAEVIQLLFDHVDREAIVWISMGALRYLPALKMIGENRFSGSTLFSEEFVRGLDGKLRYFRSQREELYSHLYSLLQERVAAETCVYLCMESDEIWTEIFGYAPKSRGGLAKMLDHAALSTVAK